MSDLANSETGNSKLAFTALLSCPFCGRDAAEVKEIPADNYKFVVRCLMCGAQSTPRTNESVARSDWNQRQRESDLIDTVKACVVAAGGSKDVDELEREMAGKRPSEFVEAQMELLRRALRGIAKYWDECEDALDSDELNEVIIQIARRALSGRHDLPFTAGEVRRLQNWIGVTGSVMSDEVWESMDRATRLLYVTDMTTIAR